MYFDTHSHLNDPKLIEDIENILKRAKDNNIDKILVAGYDVESSLKAIELSNKYDSIYCAVGIHPENIDNEDLDSLKEIEKMIKEKKVVAIGEIGLDYYWRKDNKEKQKEFFLKQIELANKHKKPIIIHSREAQEDTYTTLKDYKDFDLKGVMHCYSYSQDNIAKFINLNMMISFGGPITFLNAKTPKEALLKTPLDRLLIETDSPYLSPHPLRGKTNEPANLKYIFLEVLKIKNLYSEKEIEEQLYKNSCDFFGLKNEN